MLVGLLLISACREDPARVSSAPGSELRPMQGITDLSPGLETVSALPQRLFISGHSLTAQPLGADLMRIAASLGADLFVEEQIRDGSAIRARLEECQPPLCAAPGAERGDLRDDARKIDTLLITERHDLAGVLVWEETVPSLRRYHDRFIAQNSSGQTFFFEPWLSLASKDAPEDWVAYERAASQAWRCVTTRVNATLARASRPDRVVNLPVGLALAELIARVSQGSLPGFAPRSPREAVDLFIKDDVHPTRLGFYYVALVTYSGLFRITPVGAWAPENVDSVQAEALQQFAWTSLEARESRSQALPLAACRSYFRDSFLDVFWPYFKRAHLQKEQGYWEATLRAFKLSRQWRKIFAEGDGNPLRDPGPLDDY